MRVLLVDDEPELVSALAERLEMRGIETRWETTGEAAIAAMAADCCDIAVLDVKMPGMGGLALKARLAKICPRMKFVFLTAYGSQQVFDSVSTEMGSDFYLVKPIQIEALVDTLHRLAEHRKEAP